MDRRRFLLTSLAGALAVLFALIDSAASVQCAWLPLLAPEVWFRLVMVAGFVGVDR